MVQANLLLSFRKQLNINNQSTKYGFNYNFVLGLWEKDSSYIISNLWRDEYGTTLITETREGIDQSEGSC